MTSLNGVDITDVTSARVAYEHFENETRWVFGVVRRGKPTTVTLLIVP